MKERDYNIDFLRGIATLWIIVIHTAFWSGEIYLPSWFSNIALLLDIPAFMFIAGISFSYSSSVSKNIKGLINQWKKWCYFLILYVLLLYIFYRGTFSFRDVLKWIFYYFPKDPAIKVVPGSIWFMIMYIKTTLLCTIIISLNNYFIKAQDARVKNLVNIILLLLIIFGYTASSNSSFLILSSEVSFYAIVYLIGYLASNYKINLKQTITYSLTNLILLLLVFQISKLSINNLQDIKFPPSIPYIFVSAFQIIIFWYLKDYLKIKKTNIINYVGRNAIFYYFAQGISSSFLYAVYGHISSLNIYMIFIIMLIINIALASIIAIFLEKSYTYLTSKLKVETIKKMYLPTQKAKSKI